MKIIKLALTLHKNQLKIYNSYAQVKVVISGRGFGKSMLLLITGVVFCWKYKEPINPLSPQVALIAMPTLKMAKSIFWKPIVSLIKLLPIVENVNNSDYRVTFKGERPDLILRGADLAGERLRGLNLCFAGLDEYQDFNPDVWDEILDPALSRNENWQAVIIGTPKGKLNHLYKFHQKAIENEGWEYFHFTTKDNPFFPRKHLRRAKRELPAKVYRQEFQASFEDFDGQIATEADKSKHLKKLSRQVDEQFYIGIDPGTINPALSLFGVTKDYVFKVYDSFYKNTGEAYTTADLVTQAENLIGKHGQLIKRIFIPDDRSDLVKTFRQAGYNQAVLVKRHSPSPVQRAGILNTLFKCNRLLFDSSQSEFFDEILSYHREIDKSGNVTEEVAKGQVDHRCDSLLYGIGRLSMDFPILLPVPSKILPELTAA